MHSLGYLIDAATLLWLGFLGAAAGSFLNVVAYRMPLGMSIIWKPSHCPKCGHPIRAYDNIPVLGWLLLQGRCRDCRQPIPARYAIVESVMGILFVILAHAELFSGGANLPNGPITQPAGAIDTLWVPVWPLIGLVAFHGLLLSLLMAVFLVDLDNHRVPLGLVIFAFVLGLLPSLLDATSIPEIGLSLPASTGRFAIVSDALLGLVVGGGIALSIHGAMEWASLRPIARVPVNIWVVLAMIGLYLGWQAVVCITAMSGLLCLGCRLMLRNKPAFKSTVMLPVLLVTTLAHIVLWKHLPVSAFHDGILWP